ncbi:MAG TPA: hypothetical protein VE956_12570 [Nodularia sp. (in: cyanobacteria)]|nr:hypothetical protein [Nodularia sp. (in: cyanobacteria)]
MTGEQAIALIAPLHNTHNLGRSVILGALLAHSSRELSRVGNRCHVYPQKTLPK